VLNEIWAAIIFAKLIIFRVENATRYTIIYVDGCVYCDTISAAIIRYSDGVVEF